MNPSGARKVSDYLGRYITEHYDVADRRGEAAYAAWADDAAAYREKKLADFENQSELASSLMLLHDDDFACTVTIGAGNALFENEKLMTLMQNIAREHVFEEDLFASGPTAFSRWNGWTRRRRAAKAMLRRSTGRRGRLQKPSAQMCRKACISP